MKTFTFATDQENNGEKMIADVILRSIEISDDIEGNESAIGERCFVNTTKMINLMGLCWNL